MGKGELVVVDSLLLASSRNRNIFSDNSVKYREYEGVIIKKPEANCSEILKCLLCQTVKMSTVFPEVASHNSLAIS